MGDTALPGGHSRGLATTAFPSLPGLQWEGEQAHLDVVRRAEPVRSPAFPRTSYDAANAAGSQASVGTPDFLVRKSNLWKGRYDPLSTLNRGPWTQLVINGSGRLRSDKESKSCDATCQLIIRTVVCIFFEKSLVDINDSCDVRTHARFRPERCTSMRQEPCEENPTARFAAGQKGEDDPTSGLGLGRD